MKMYNVLTWKKVGDAPAPPAAIVSKPVEYVRVPMREGIGALWAGCFTENETPTCHKRTVMPVVVNVEAPYNTLSYKKVVAEVLSNRDKTNVFMERKLAERLIKELKETVEAVTNKAATEASTWFDALPDHNEAAIAAQLRELNKARETARPGYDSYVLRLKRNLCKDSLPIW